MVAVGSRQKQFKVECRVCFFINVFQTAAGRLKTEDFSDDPRSGSNARGFIDFDEEGS